MALSYLDYLVLDTFSMKEEIKISSLYHILTGKRTVSVMLQAMRYEKEAYFAVFPRLKQPYLEAKILHLVESGYLSFNQDGYFLSELGTAEVEEYFQHHLRIDQPAQLRYALVLPKFRKKILFLSQVLSEASYQNPRYLPLEERTTEQLWVKRFLREWEGSKLDCAKQMGREWLHILQHASLKSVELFVDQLEGHQWTRKTSSQSAEEKNLDEAEVLQYWHRDWLQILLYLENQQDGFVIFKKIFQELLQQGGLCSFSTQETYRMWAVGLTLEQIIMRRKLKASTIHDHFTEMAILYPEFPFHHFLSEERQDFVRQAIKNKKKLHYSEIQNHFPEISFFESRLMQIMNEVGIR